jgi:hypothetical protein
MAMRHAPDLKAIIAVDATAGLFHDDVHYIDGMAHVDEFELNMDMAPGMAGAPDYTLDEKVLGPRFDTPPWSLLYLRHQHDGPFWRERVRPYNEIKIPCFLIGGLLDGYPDSLTDLLEQAKAPLKAVIGPWNHTSVHAAHKSVAGIAASAGGILLLTGTLWRVADPNRASTCNIVIRRIRISRTLPENGVSKIAVRLATHEKQFSFPNQITLWISRPRSLTFTNSSTFPRLAWKEDSGGASY